MINQAVQYPVGRDFKCRVIVITMRVAGVFYRNVVCGMVPRHGSVRFKHVQGNERRKRDTCEDTERRTKRCCFAESFHSNG